MWLLVASVVFGGICYLVVSAVFLRHFALLRRFLAAILHYFGIFLGVLKKCHPPAKF
jgi:hypothetical protein